MNNKELRRAASDYAINNPTATIEQAFQAGAKTVQDSGDGDILQPTEYSTPLTRREALSSVPKTIRRMLQHLYMASLEMDSFIHDDRIRPEVRKTFARYKANNVDWTLRQIRTDMKKLSSFELVKMDLEGDKARDLQELIDFVLQFDNIDQILAELKGAFSEQLSKQP